MISNEKIKSKMQGLVLEDIGNLKLESVDVPAIDENQVLLKIEYCGICSSDIERVFINGTYHFPTIPGHEFSGIVVGVNGEDDRDLLGKRAAVFPLLPCFKCSACLDEKYAQCSNYNYFGSRCDGAFSEYLAVPKWNLVFFDQLDPAVGAMCEPAAVALHAFRRVDIKKGSKALVIGSGTIGLLLGLFAKNSGVDVYIGARNQVAIDFITSLGLKTINTNNLENEVLNVTSGEGFNYIFEAVGTNTALEQAIMSSANFANIVVIGNPKGDISLKQKIYWKILRKQLTLTGSWNSSYGSNINDWHDALLFMAKYENVFSKLISYKFPLSDASKAFDILRDKQQFTVKVMFKVGDNND